MILFELTFFIAGLKVIGKSSIFAITKPSNLGFDQNTPPNIMYIILKATIASPKILAPLGKEKYYAKNPPRRGPINSPTA